MQSDKLLVNECDSECHKAVVGDSEVHKGDEVTEVRLEWEIDDELGEVSEVDYDEVSEVREADEWQSAGWALCSDEKKKHFFCSVFFFCEKSFFFFFF